MRILFLFKAYFTVALSERRGTYLNKQKYTEANGVVFLLSTQKEPGKRRFLFNLS